MKKKESKIRMETACIMAINSFKKGQLFYARDIRNKIVELRPQNKHTYQETLLRQCRRYCRDMYVCVNTHKGLYERV